MFAVKTDGIYVYIYSMVYIWHHNTLIFIFFMVITISKVCRKLDGVYVIMYIYYMVHIWHLSIKIFPIFMESQKVSLEIIKSSQLFILHTVTPLF